MPGHRYGVRLTNTTGERVLVVLSVDGVNAVTGQTAHPSQAGYVLEPWQSTEITGWRKSYNDVAQFVFTALPDSYAARTGRPDNIGTIGVAVFRERAYIRPMPPAPPIACSNDVAKSARPPHPRPTAPTSRRPSASAPGMANASGRPPPAPASCAPPRSSQVTAALRLAERIHRTRHPAEAVAALVVAPCASVPGRFRRRSAGPLPPALVSGDMRTRERPVMPARSSCGCGIDPPTWRMESVERALNSFTFRHGRAPSHSAPSLPARYLLSPRRRRTRRRSGRPNGLRLALQLLPLAGDMSLFIAKLLDCSGDSAWTKHLLYTPADLPSRHEVGQGNVIRVSLTDRESEFIHARDSAFT